MRRSSLLLAIAASPALAEIIPATPTEEEIFRTGDSCVISWDPDTQPGGWKTMRIDLMSGNPPGASIIDNVVESVGTTASDPTSFSWTCPPVDFDGPVYSYMFTPNDSLDPPEYSSQFTISSFTGSVDVAGVASASVSVDPSPTNPDSYTPGETDVADASQGAIHLGHTNDPNSGEEMLEDIPTHFGGSDTPQVTASADGPNFLAEAVRPPDPSFVKSTDNAQGQAMAAIVPSGSPVNMNMDDPIALVTATAGLGIATRMIVSSTRSSSSSAASASSTRNNLADSSVAAFRHTESMVRALFFALCVGHFVL